MICIEDLYGFRVRGLLVFGIGGGGDVVSAAMLAKAFERCGVRVYVGSIVWERFTVDPVPGPVELENLFNARRLGGHSCIIDESTYAVRGGRRFVPQAARVAKVLGTSVYVADIWGGVEGYKRGLREISDFLGVEACLAVDVGGDSIAIGDEEDLWSPLADSMGIAAFNSLENSVLAVHGPGSDGELSTNYVLMRISEICSMGGCLGARGMTRRDAEVLEMLLGEAYSEAGRIPLMAFRGEYGVKPIRDGTRKVEISVIQTLTFFLDVGTVYRASRMAQLVDNSVSLEEARRNLNRAGIYTEYDLGIDLRAHLDAGGSLSDAAEVRLRGIKRLSKVG